MRRGLRVLCRLMRPITRLLPLLLTALLCPLLQGCRYNFVPVIPREAALELPIRLTSAALVRSGTRLEVSAKLEGQIKSGYLGVVWFEGDHELGRDSVYLDEAQRQAHFVLEAPQKGNYRAMLLFEGTLLRQLDMREVGGL